MNSIVRGAHFGLIWLIRLLGPWVQGDLQSHELGLGSFCSSGNSEGVNSWGNPFLKEDMCRQHISMSIICPSLPITCPLSGIKSYMTSRSLQLKYAIEDAWNVLKIVWCTSITYSYAKTFKQLWLLDSSNGPAIDWDLTVNELVTHSDQFLVVPLGKVS